MPACKRPGTKRFLGTWPTVARKICWRSRTFGVFFESAEPLRWCTWAPPCGSFSLARGARAPRSRQYPLGKPNLPPADVARVALGSQLLEVCCKIVRLCLRRNIRVSLENPTGYRLFECPSARRLLNHPACQKVKTVFCAFGTPWRKAATFARWRFSERRLLERQCSGVPCLFTKKPHQRLRGNGPYGVAWTRIAQPYPSRLCSLRAKAALNHDLRCQAGWLSTFAS